MPAPDVLGYLSIHLHAHLPFVRHPEHAEFLEEDWLYEAVSETYLPLLRVFDRLTDEEIPFRISLTLSPPVVAMLSNWNVRCSAPACEVTQMPM